MNGVASRPLAVLRARSAAELSTRRYRAWFRLWNALALLLSSCMISVLRLAMAAGSFGVAVFLDYFRQPTLLLLNTLPVLLLQLLFFGLFGRQWIAFLADALVILLASAGNVYKLRFRFEPFVASDFGAITAGLGVAHNYDLTPNSRILLALAATLLGTVLLLLFCRARPRLWLRLSLILCVGLSVWPLWRFVYSSSSLYERNTSTQGILDPTGAAEIFVSKGFVYPFLHSITDLSALPPEGYDAQEAAELLESFADAPIPEDKKVNLIVFQLESFRDVSLWGLEGVHPEAYAIWNELKEQSVHGTLVVNNFAGGTGNTERGVLASSIQPLDPRAPYPSHVWYLRDQGYACFGNHNYYCYYYNRININGYLGFENYRYFEDHFEKVYGTPPSFSDSDEAFFIEVLDEYRRREAEGQPLFSFDVTLQGHYPFSTDSLPEKLFLDRGIYPEELECALANYLASAQNTQVQILSLLDELQRDETPVVVMFYGDHCPNIGDSSYVSTGLGVNLDPSTREGFLNMFSTEYLIWGNDAAKAALGKDFRGEGPMVSPCFLMNVLFDEMGWEGSAFQQFSRRIQEKLPVICTSGFYVEDGRLCTSLSREGKEALRLFNSVFFYQAQVFSKEINTEG